MRPSMVKGQDEPPPNNHHGTLMAGQGSGPLQLSRSDGLHAQINDVQISDVHRIVGFVAAFLVATSLGQTSEIQIRPSQLSTRSNLIRVGESPSSVCGVSQG